VVLFYFMRSKVELRNQSSGKKGRGEMHRFWRIVLIVSIGFLLLVNSGCAPGYMQDRGNDALDILELGLIVNKDSKPQLGLYFDFFNITPLGYANVEGTALGLANRQAGKLDYIHKSWGILAWGSEEKGAGTFNPRDPHQARPDQAGLEDWPQYNVGIPRLIIEDNSPPVLQFLECNRVIHLGWIGMYMNVRPVDILDFLLGWTTIDIMGDDESRWK